MEQDKKDVLSISHCFGSSVGKGYYNCIAIIEENKRQKIVFPVGRYIVKKTIIGNQMTFHKINKCQKFYKDSLQFIDCIAINNKKNQVAVAQRIKNSIQFQISIYSLNSFDQKPIQLKPILDFKAKQFKFLVFAPSDKRILVGLIGEPQNCLVYFDTQEKHRAVAVSNLCLKQVSRITVNPVNPTLCLVTGKGYIKIFKMEDYQIKIYLQNFPKVKKTNFTQSAWLDKNRFIVGTFSGEVYILNINGQLKQLIQNIFKQEDPMQISCIKTFSKGFIVGSQNGKFSMWISILNEQQNQQNTTYIFETKWNCIKQRRCKVVYIDFTANQDIMIVSFNNNDIATIGMNQIKPGLKIERGKDQNVQLEYIYKGFHNSQISNIETCYQRPLIMTFSKYNSTIRIWNYIKPNCQLIRLFSFKIKESMAEDKTMKPIMSIAFHPSGYYMAVGSPDKTRIFHVLFSELRQYDEILIKNTSFMKFSNGGHYLAIAYSRGKNINSNINIYQSYTLQMIISFTCAINLIFELKWQSNDKRLYGVSQSEFHIFDSKNWVHKQHAFQIQLISSMAIQQYDHKCYIYLASRKNKQQFIDLYSFNPQTGDIISEESYLIEENLTKLEILSMETYRFLFCATTEGMIKMFSLPFNVKEFMYINLYLCQIKSMVLSSCGEYLITGGADGTLFILNTIIYKRVFTQRFSGQSNLSDIVMVPKQQLQQFIRNEKQLSNSLQDLQNRLDYVSQEEKKRMDKQKEQLKIKMEKQIEELNNRFQLLKKQKREIEAQNQNLLKKQVKTHIKAIQQLETLYQRKLVFENEKLQRLEQQLINTKKFYQDKIKNMIQTNEKNIKIFKSQFKQSINVAENMLQKTKVDTYQMDSLYKKKLFQIEKDYEEEIIMINQNHTNQMNDLKMKNAQLKCQIQAYQSQRKIENGQFLRKVQIIKKLQENQKNLKKLLKEQRNKLQQKVKELKEKQEIIKNKENNLRQNQIEIADLKKSKHVLSYRATQMRMVIEPKDQQIQKLKQQLYKLEKQFEEMLKLNKNLNQRIKNMIKQNERQKSNLKQQEIQFKKKQDYLNEIISDIHNIVKNMDKKQYNKQMLLLYQKYVQNNQDKIQIKHDQKGVQEMERHMNYLKKSINQVSQSTKKVIQRRTRQIYKKTKQNAQLIYDINQIRKQHKIFLSKLEDKTKKLEQAVIQNQRLKLQISKKKISYHSQPKQPDQKPQGMIKRIQSAGYKKQGKLIKGSMFDPASLLNLQKQKVNQLQIQLQNVLNFNQILREKIKLHIFNNKCNSEQFQQLLRIL